MGTLVDEPVAPRLEVLVLNGATELCLQIKNKEIPKKSVKKEVKMSYASFL